MTFGRSTHLGDGHQLEVSYGGGSVTVKGRAVRLTASSGNLGRPDAPANA